ncbi:MarR family winged helix-turn-helix transcriptional regulator [Lutispora saccharofermentans]|uniref:MarR family transcriptional regulator n=1 Tax=Lutispora saccharofermentans TaxID=3024236 RepID=A0ABT1NF98_9FIRM|nr:MarR family transcriptional regulator [Lutispora saccharofermentans]MCQ1529919.1 MarR family transcriptional regulator [Lutispora saccharofermentans]
MKHEKLKELFYLMFEFMPLYNQTMGSIYRKDYDVEPRLNKNQKRALFIIKKQGKIIPSALGRALDMQRGSLTTLVDLLEKHEFVSRAVDNDDRRKLWLFLTPKGEEYISVLMGNYEKEFAQMFDKIELEDISKMIDSIGFSKDILKNIKETGGVLCR